jgi:tripartite-type tricarboxylate transporter receptor subunit TctC
LILLLAFIGMICTPGSPFAASPFYEGKTVRIVVGTTAGGGMDTYSRAIARHMSKHIPGHPNLIVENMPGAGGLIAVKHLYHVAKPDGLTIGNFNSAQVMAQILGREGVEFDAQKFEWVGVPVKDHVVCALTKKSGIGNVEQWIASKAAIKIGGMSPGNTTSDVPRILKAALGLPIQVVEGYKGTAEIRLAAEGGEIAGGCWQWESIKVTWSKGLTSGDVLILLQMTEKPLPELLKVPLAIGLAKTEEARQLIKAGITDPAGITRLYGLPPSTPKERVQLLRKAFQETLKDPEFLGEAQKSKLDVNPLNGGEVEEVIRGLFGLKSGTVAKLKEVLYK